MEDSRNNLKAAQLACQSLRRAVQDMKGLRKALKKMKPVPASTDQDNAKAKNVMNGRTNLSLGKAVNLTDPPLIQGFKEILPKREIRTVKDPKDLVGFTEAARPFLIRKGRNVVRLLAKTDTHKAMLENTVEQFRQSVVSTKSVRLVKVQSSVCKLLKLIYVMTLNKMTFVLTCNFARLWGACHCQYLTYFC